MAVGEHIEEYQGMPVQDFDPGRGIANPQKVVYRVGQMEYDGPGIMEVLPAFLDDPRVGEVTALVIGCWSQEGEGNREVIEALVGARGKLAGLRALFMGDIPYEEQEISWIVQDDLSPLLDAFPQLEELRARGGSGLAFSKLDHAHLKRLILETGGLGKDVVGQICGAKLPELEHLELWLGDDYYGGDVSIEDLQPILSGTLFPKLTYLGLCNCRFADDLAAAVVNAPVVRQLEVLDLSLGNLGDEGARALLALPTDARLRRLDIRHHYVSDEVVAQLRQLPFEVDASDRQEAQYDERYIAHSE
jgi:hypothetical protein